MLNAANIALAAISYYTKDLSGQIFAFFIIAIAAAEVAVGLGFLILCTSGWVLWISTIYRL